MRIKQIRFKNLNSLNGEWTIDLSDPAYASDGIFAIVGPTGAGKTTILDAICLALYGRTPRLNKVTKSTNEIMSQHTGECFAEVVFETQSGSFRCHWSQQKAKKKPDGELQAPKQEIADAVSGTILNTKLKEVADQIEAVTGLDFDRFTRSILLAQGGFDTFLKADPDKRSPILEQITGTEIYSEISIKVHEKQRAEKVKLDRLNSENQGIVILSAEEVKEIEEVIGAKRKAEQALAEKMKETRTALNWLNEIAGLRTEIKLIQDEESTLKSKIDAFQSDRTRLAWANKAIPLDAVHANLEALRKNQSAIQDNLLKEREGYPIKDDTVKKASEVFRFATEQVQNAKKQLKDAEPVIQSVRLMDSKIKDLKERINTQLASCVTVSNSVEKNELDRKANVEVLSATQVQLGSVTQYLESHAQDEWLIGGLAGVETQLSVLKAKQAEINQKESDREKAVRQLVVGQESHKSYLEKCSRLKSEFESIAQNVKTLEENLAQLLGTRLLREYRSEKDSLIREMTLRQEIKELSELRGNLEDGKPCPLCGAVDHPYAAGNIPELSETEAKIAQITSFIEKAEEQEGAVLKLKEEETKVHKKYLEEQKEESIALNNIRTIETSVQELTDHSNRLNIDFNEMQDSITLKLHPLGINEVQKSEIPLLLDSLRQRLENWKTKSNERAKHEELILSYTHKIANIDAINQTLNAELAEKKQVFEGLEKDCQQQMAKRQEEFGLKDPDTEAQQLSSNLLVAEGQEKTTRGSHELAVRDLEATKTRIESLVEQSASTEINFKTVEVEFLSALAPLGFNDEKQYLDSKLSFDQINELTAKAKELDENNLALRSRFSDRDKSLANLVSKNLTQHSLEELTPQILLFEDNQKELLSDVAGLSNRLGENERSKERSQSKKQEIDKQTIESRRWETLHSLIGSADGKKLRNFAQGLTFDLMISYANRQLHKMSDRYLLIRDESQALELNVVDNYQAGRTRSTKNLSGGESFIVSLTLALGLSQMSSQKVRLDSLFLDEGFGTLDEDALEMALETLSNLNQDGKIIGIISHVPALKERIGAQINVIPQTGGRSIITGPGCS